MFLCVLDHHNINIDGLVDVVASELQRKVLDDVLLYHVVSCLNVGTRVKSGQ